MLRKRSYTNNLQSYHNIHWDGLFGERLYKFSLSTRVSAFISLALVVVLVVQNNTILTDFKLYLTLLTYEN